MNEILFLRFLPPFILLSSSYRPPINPVSIPYWSRIGIRKQYGNNTGLIRERYGNDRRNIEGWWKYYFLMMSEIMLMLDWLVLLIWGASASITTMEKLNGWFSKFIVAWGGNHKRNAETTSPPPTWWLCMRCWLALLACARCCHALKSLCGAWGLSGDFFLTLPAQNHFLK